METLEHQNKTNKIYFVLNEKSTYNIETVLEKIRSKAEDLFQSLFINQEQKSPL